MCGIFAIFLKRPLRDADIGLGRIGRDMLAYRGPDGSGEWMDQERGVYLGHRRLAIIDPTNASRQPMVRDGLAMAYNGELYNFREIRADLVRRGHKFRTAGDVEVVLEAWRRWKQQALDRFDGMFALAVWDGAAGHLAVDPFGEKPLYWSETEDGIYVSSELAPLVRLLDLSPALESDFLPSYLALGYVPAPRTAYPGTYRLGPASVLRVENGRIANESRYWQVPLGAPGRGSPEPLSEQALDGLQTALGASLSGRLVADVPMCLFLSSGVDSGLVAAMAKRDFGRDIPCVTVSFPGSEASDEAASSAETAAFLGLPHRTLESQLRDHRKNVDDVLELFGQPADATTALSIRQMTAAIAPDLKVGLTGSGGDETAFGYGKFCHFFRLRHLYGAPEPLRLILGAAARSVGGLIGAAGRYAVTVGVADAERYIAQKNDPAIAWLRGVPGFREWTRSLFSGISEPIELSAPRFELTNVMPNLRLPSMDLGSMRSSVELRTPFLSRAFCEEVARHDPRSFMAFGQKSVTRRLLRRYLPPRLVDRPKQGFVFPQGRILHGREPPSGVAAVLGGRSSAETVWHHLDDGPGWRRIAVRLVVLARFLEPVGP